MIELVEGLRDAFDPARFREFLSKVISAFETFFTTLDPSNPGSAAGVFLDNMQNAFGTTFGGEDGAGILQKLKDGFNKIATFLVNAFAGLVPHVVNGMVMLMTTLTNVLSGKEGAGPNIQSGDFISEELATALNNAFSVLQTEVPKLAEPFNNLLCAIIEQLKESGVLEPALKGLGAYILATTFGPSAILGAIRLIGQNIWEGLKSIFSSATAAETAEEGGKSFMGRFADGFKRFANRHLPTFTKFFGKIRDLASRMGARIGGVFSKMGRFMRPLSTLFRGLGQVFSRSIGLIVSVAMIGIDTFKRFKLTTEEFGDRMSSVGAFLGSLVSAVLNFLHWASCPKTTNVISLY